MNKRKHSMINLMSKLSIRKTLQTQKAIWNVFGVDYEAEKRKQEEIYATLRKQQRKHKRADVMLKTGGGGGRRQHTDVKKFRAFCLKILGLETQRMREEIVKQLEELAKEAHRNAMDNRLKAVTRVKWARVEAYIFQVVSGITKQYDVVEINKRIKELKELVQRELGKRARQD